MHEIDRKNFLIKKAESKKQELWKILKTKKNLTKVSGITISI